MVGGLFGVHNIDMGMCSSFAQMFDIRKKKKAFFYIIIMGGCCRIATFSSFFTSFLCFYLYLCVLFCVFVHRMASCKVGMAQIYVCCRNVEV